MSGLPIVAYAAVLVLSVVRRRWRKTGLLIAGALLAAILIVAITLLFDMQAKPLIEHYDWSGWHQAVYLGAYTVGAIVLLARPAGVWADSFRGWFAVAQPRFPFRADSASEPRPERPPRRVEPAGSPQGSRKDEKSFMVGQWRSGPTSSRNRADRPTMDQPRPNSLDDRLLARLMDVVRRRSSRVRRAGVVGRRRC